MTHTHDDSAPEDEDAVPDRAREDELLAIRCQMGDPDGFEDLIRRWNGPLWRYLRRLAGNEQDAQELLQDVWIRVLRGMARLRDASKLRAWLFAIARRAAMDALRAQYAAPRNEDVSGLDPPAPDVHDTLHEDLDAVEQELQRLPVIEREVLTLFYLDELSLGEVADVLAIPVGTVKSRLFRARQLLRRELTQKGTPS
jgi:RNA polymerase sigma-70 factor (ECF subfamily)